MIAELKQFQDVIYREIELKASQIQSSSNPNDTSQTTKLRNEVMMNSTQYKKLLELMLDLEKKVDKRFIETHHETANAILNACDTSQLKRDFDDQLSQFQSTLESKFDQIFSARMTAVEDELDK